MTCSPRPRPNASSARRRWRRACVPLDSTTSSARSTCSVPGSRCAPDRGRSPVVGHPLGPAGHRQDDAGAGDRACDVEGVRAAVGGDATVKDVREVVGGRAAAARRARAGHDPVPRRGPPVQQGTAGRAAAVGRGRAARPHRRDHREPVLRGQPAAAVALDAVPARAARRRRRRRRWCERGLEAEGAPPTTTRSPTSSTGGRRRRQTSPRSRSRSPWRGAAREHRHPARRRAGARHEALRYGSDDHYDVIARSSRASGGPMPTPGCTGWPACSRRVRTLASSPGGW